MRTRAIRLLAAGVLTLAASASAHAGSYLVNATFDAVDANVGNGICASGGGQCTLRAAFQEASSNPDADVIVLDAPTYFLSIVGGGENLSASGDLDVTTAVQIVFLEFGPATIDGDGDDPVFHVQPGGSLTATDLVIRDGGDGGVWNEGTLNLARVRITANGGGAVGALANLPGGTAIVIDSTIDGNVGGYGGGVVNQAMLTLTNVTISGNAGYGAGLLHLSGSPVSIITNSTIVANDATAYGAGGGLFITAGSATLRNTVISGNSAPQGPDCYGTLTSAGYNLVEDTTDCVITGDTTGSITGVSANLQALADNGGAVPTCAPNTGSPVLDAGNPADPGSGGNACESADARGYPRDLGGIACDIGAFESGRCPLLPENGCRPTQDNKAKLILKNNADDSKDLLVWKWLEGSLTTDAEYGNGALDAYTMCIWNGSSLVASAVIPAGGTCTPGANPCWTDIPTGLKYKNTSLTPDGVLKAVFKEGADTRSKIVVRGKGNSLRFVPPPWTQPGGVQVQIRRAGGACWQSTHGGGTIKNSSAEYKHVTGQ